VGQETLSLGKATRSASNRTSSRSCCVLALREANSNKFLTSSCSGRTKVGQGIFEIPFGGFGVFQVANDNLFSLHKLLSSKTGFCQFHCSKFYYSEAEALCRILAEEIADADIAPHRVHAAVAGLLHDGAFGFAGGGRGGEAGAQAELFSAIKCDYMGRTSSAERRSCFG
jgi:hypothetical protein